MIGKSPGGIGNVAKKRIKSFPAPAFWSAEYRIRFNPLIYFFL